jgi:glycosyltransferase involved in cell wall biosynthesis
MAAAMEQPLRPRVAAVIPTLNEAATIVDVIAAIPRGGAAAAAAIDEVIVVDGGSSDGTVDAARAAGARVLAVGRGYGRACQAGVDAAGGCDIIVFLDGDGSDGPEQIPLLVAPITDGRADFVIGSRTRGARQPGSMSLHQRLAGYTIGAAMRLLYGVGYTDMAPLRAIGRDTLLGLGMREMTYGWNLEMQMRAARAGLRVLELPVAHRRRAGGVSKVSGSLRGTLKAGWRIALTFVRVALEPRGPRPAPAPPPVTAPAKR